MFVRQTFSLSFQCLFCRQHIIIQYSSSFCSKFKFTFSTNTQVTFFYHWMELILLFLYCAKYVIEIAWVPNVIRPKSTIESNQTTKNKHLIDQFQYLKCQPLSLNWGNAFFDRHFQNAWINENQINDSILNVCKHQPLLSNSNELNRNNDG